MTSRPSARSTITGAVSLDPYVDIWVKPCQTAAASRPVHDCSTLEIYRWAMSRPTPFTHPVDVRYLEVDQQGVVFNMWYLAYFDDAMTAFLREGGLPYVDMLAAGFDTQVVHTELDWLGPVGWGDPAVVDVGLSKLG